MSYNKLIFIDKNKEKEWNNLGKSHKDFIMNNLFDTASKMENKIAIEMLCHVINDLIERVEKLEKILKRVEL